ncbi:unnamed protein product [Schistocephalus solidus]|uniref:Uncharacterized protein n=1 Tax=Schistocephalus solidus TaxID=70667 RepID=A0A183SGG0_SCHSO|nr:unnamed protein product [Schistocephalus solidus]
MGRRLDPGNGFIYQYNSPFTVAAYGSPALSPIYFTQPQYISGLPAVGNVNEYEYCNSTYNSSLSSEMRTFRPAGLLEPTDGSHASPAAPPPLPERPTTLLPLSPESVVFRSSNAASARMRATSTNSSQPLLTCSSVDDDVLALPRRSCTDVRSSTNWFLSLRR